MQSCNKIAHSARETVRRGGPELGSTDCDECEEEKEEDGRCDRDDE